MSGKRYTEEEKKWLAKQDPGLTYKQVTEAFNDHFGASRTESQIKDLMNKRLKLKRTPKGRFEKGAKPRHKVGDEIVKAGYIWVKINDTYFEGTASTEKYYANWRRKSDVVYEATHGKIPEGRFLIFLDGDPMNCDVSNLYPVSRAMHAIMCSNNWYNGDPGFTLAAISYCELLEEIKHAKVRGENNDLQRTPAQDLHRNRPG